MKLSIRIKFYALIMPLVAISLFLLIAAISPVAEIRKHMEHFKSNVAHTMTAEEFDRALSRQSKEYTDFILSNGNSKHGRDIEKSADRAGAMLVKWKGILRVGDDKEHLKKQTLLDDFEKKYAEAGRKGREVVDAVRQARMDSARYLFLEKVKPLVEKGMLNVMEQQISEDEEELKEDAYHLSGLVSRLTIFTPKKMRYHVQAMQTHVLHAIKAEKFSRLFGRQISEYPNYVLVPDSEGEARIIEMENRTLKALEDWRKELVHDDLELEQDMGTENREETRTVDEVEKGFRQMSSAGRTALDLVKRGKRDEAIDLVLNKMELILNNTLPKADKIVKEEGMHLDENLSMISTNLKHMELGIGIMSFIVLLVGVGSPWILSRKLVGPVLKLKQAANLIGEGKLQTRINVDSEDEIGDLASTFNSMAAYLSETTVSKDRLEKHNYEMTLLREMGDMLQTSNTTEEANTVISMMAGKIFSDVSGALYLLAPSRNFLEIAASWGAPLYFETVFEPEKCWALRSGRTISAENAKSRQLCHHVSAEFSGGTLCVPMTAQGESLGILHLQIGPQINELPPEKREDLLASKKELAVTVAEHIGLSLANLRLRERLRMQSIRDPLTGLFNRRYMEESMEREFHRAGRNNRPVGIIMVDIDHFKKFNDDFGHDAGDAVLRELGAFLHHHIRAEDIACRFGGEEFAMIMPDADMDITKQRAEQLRDGIRQVRITHNDKFLGTITLSLGVAVFPEHGNTPEAVLKSADEALYRAKREGRDRVATA